MDPAAEHIASFIRRQDADAEARAATQRGSLVAAAQDLARLLLNDFGVMRVWVFGSLAWGAPDEASDIDVAVEGLDPGCYFQALAAVLAAAPTRVDLVRMEEADASLRERVLGHGLLLETER